MLALHSFEAPLATKLIRWLQYLTNILEDRDLMQQLTPPNFGKKRGGGDFRNHQMERRGKGWNSSLGDFNE